MDKFLKEYSGHTFEDWGAYCSDDFKSIARKFKNFIKRVLPECEIIGHSCNHYYFGGFLKNNGVFIYYSYSWNRISPLNIHNRSYSDGILIRYAEHEKDFRGEHNNFTSFAGFARDVKEMFERRVTQKAS